MEHPVQEWQDYVHKKWLQLPSDVKIQFSASSDLAKSFMMCWSQLQQEEEEVLEKLCSDLSVKKEPHAVLFYKLEGNKRFGRKQYTAAAVLYSKAISHASPDNEEMAICFANRSAVLFHLAHYSECLEDIERAKEHGLPDRLKCKILKRQTECFQRLKESTNPSASSSKTESARPVENSTAYNTDVLIDKLELLKLNSNSQLSNASSSLCLQNSALKGRYLQASKDIGQGDILMWEDAFVSVIIPERTTRSDKYQWDTSITSCDLYCHHCLSRVIAPLSCQYCSFAKYCSHECMSKAWKSYHNVECSLGEVLLTLGVFCQTALRVVLVAGIEQVSQHVSQIRSAEPQVIAPSHTIEGKAGGKYCSNYEAIVNLLPHVKHHKDEFKFLCGLTAAALCKKLCMNKMGEAIGELSLSEKPNIQEEPMQKCSSKMMVVGPTLFRHMLQLHCNAQAVTVLQQEHDVTDYSPVESQKSSRLATAVFPVLSLLNHSCNPNTSISFQGRFVTVRASRPIQKGEEVAHCYGPHKSRLPIEERQKLLMAQYFFTCQCEACTEELGSTDKLTDFCCPKCQSPLKGEAELHCLTVTCLQRSRRDQLLLRLQCLEHTVDIAREQLQRNHIEKSIIMLKSCLSEGEKFLSPNHILLGEISDQLAQAEASKGDWRAAAMHLTRSVKHVELRYGSCSLELGHELFKLAQILFNGCEVADAMNTILRAQQILSMNYGTDHNLVRELQEMKACLLQLPGIQDSQRR
ncbi:SET and MYND domain-containing 4 isoform X1 [Pelobates cultripes]|uniref:Protein-lysine N-methyltransferase SMYD4 n=1 Tax=Pelobates cultripes TaxID=61616 RepID=A0AAD1VIM0_PELCU|nr:SET and MYND domain-containing 4 isoform X1 [Pelobates cultripes]